MFLPCVGQSRLTGERRQVAQFLSLSASVIALSLLVSPAAKAETTFDQEVDESGASSAIIVSASTPVIAHVQDGHGLSATIGQAQIAATNAVNAEDVLRYAPSLLVRKRYAGDANATLSFRNMHTTQTPRALVTVDGFTISNFLGASFFTAPKWAVLGPDDVGQAVIGYGPTSATVSGHATGGTLAITTRPITETGPRVTAQSFAQNYSYYDTDEDLFGWSVDAGYDLVLGDRGGLSVAYRHFENTGQPQEWRTVTAGSAYANQAITDEELSFLKVGAQDSTVATSEDQLRLRGTYSLASGWTLRGMAALLVDAEDALNPKSFLKDAQGQETFIGISGVSTGTARSTELLSGLGLHGQLGGWDMDLAVSHFAVLDHAERRSDSFSIITGARPATGRLSENDSGWTNAELSAKQRFGAHNLAIGLSYSAYDDRIDTWATADWQNGARGDLRDASGGSTQLLGLYAEDGIELPANTTLTLGARLENWRAADGFLTNGGTRVDYASRSLWALSPKAALKLRPDDVTTVTLSAAGATRFPTVRELYQPGLIAYGADLGEMDLNGFNPNLAPEKVADFQVTVTRHIGKAQVTLNAYRQDVRDALFTQALAIPDAVTGDLTQSSLATNIGKVRTWGADATLAVTDILIAGLDLDANLAWTDARITRNPLNPALEGNRFPRVPEWRMNASLRYSPAKDWTLAANLRAQSTPDRNIENNATSLCGTFYCVTRFHFVDLKASHSIGPVVLSLGVDNLFDQKAFVYHPYPGRSAVLSIHWNGARK